jgi:hypothetical protein
MNWRRRVDQLEKSGKILCDLFEDVDEAEIRWKPTPERWSMLEVLVHLWEEEPEDFRRRVALTLEDPAQAWPTIDPEGWVAGRRYNQRDPAEALAGFARERASSLTWLRGLEEPDWEGKHHHSELGDLRAGDLFAAWVAHDFLHIRQISTLRVEYLARSMAPYSIRYAAP